MKLLNKAEHFKYVSILTYRDVYVTLPQVKNLSRALPVFRSRKATATTQKARLPGLADETSEVSIHV